MDFPIPTKFWWTTDIFLIINPSKRMEREFHPCGQGRIDSVKINPSLLMSMKREWHIQLLRMPCSSSIVCRYSWFFYFFLNIFWLIPDFCFDFFLVFVLISSWKCLDFLRKKVDIWKRIKLLMTCRIPNGGHPWQSHKTADFFRMGEGAQPHSIAFGGVFPNIIEAILVVEISTK